jgi:serine/threonine protein kinase
MAEDSELLARSSARLGTTLRGKYRLDRVLGLGGMAVVFAATHRNQKQFAVKMLHAELSIREDIRTRFLREGYAANSLKHPGAVAVLDDDVAEDGSAFLVMELLEGEGLESLWEKSARRMSPRVVLAVGHQLLDVLAAAHAKGIVHRDIKPPNLFVLEDGTVKVLDFGIARVRAAVASGAQGTGSGLLLGTPAFMAPEQALAKSSEIDGRTDVWAVGATLFTLLSGEFVHVGENAPQIMVKAATTPARSVTTVAPSTPAGVVQIVDRAIAFDKATRWPSAAAMRDAIRDTYLAMFGEAISRAPLAALFPRQDQSAPHTEHTGPGGSPPADPNDASAPATRPVSGGTLPVGVPVAAHTPGFGIGMTTSKPVSSEAIELQGGVPGRKRTPAAVKAAVGVAAVASIAFAAFELRGRSPSGGVVAGPPPDSTVSGSVADEGATVAAGVVDAATERVGDGGAVQTPVVAAATGATAPLSATKPTVHRARPDASPATQPPTTTAPAPSPAVSPATPPKPNCNPPYVIDSSGRHQYKPECL